MIYRTIKRLARKLFPRLPEIRGKIDAALGRLHEFGWTAAIRLWCLRRTSFARTSGKLSSIKLKGYEHPLYFRLGGSDPEVIRQVFLMQEYSAVANLPNISYIVDCGANIGCTSFYLLHRYANAQVIVVEPDENNMAVCEANLAPFGDRVHYFRRGVWSNSGPMVVERGQFRDGAEWSYQVRSAKHGETPDVEAITINDLLASSGFPRIDLLKMDIEGAECEVFKHEADVWLALTKNMAIELHGNECEAAVNASLSKCDFERSHSGELSIFLNIYEIAAKG